MTERVDTIAPSPAPAPSRGQPQRETAAAAPAVARVLALQRSAGNAAVTRLLRIPLDRPQVTAPPAPRTLANGRQRFAAQLRDRWGVANVRVGTEADQVDQMRRSTPDVDPSPTSISGWQEWDPGPDSDLYDDILDAFEMMGFALGGVPEVNELRFLATDYENVRGTATARPRHGATYGGGRLNVFQPTETLTWRLPQGRSRPGARAAVTAGSQSDSRRRVIVHELAHGVFERFGSPMHGGLRGEPDVLHRGPGRAQRPLPGAPSLRRRAARRLARRPAPAAGLHRAAAPARPARRLPPAYISSSVTASCCTSRKSV